MCIMASKNQRFECLFNSLFQLTTYKARKLCTIGPLRGITWCLVHPSQSASTAEIISMIPSCSVHDGYIVAAF